MTLYIHAVCAWPWSVGSIGTGAADAHFPNLMPQLTQENTTSIHYIRSSSEGMYHSSLLIYICNYSYYR